MTPKSLIAPARLARRPVLATQRDGRLVDLVRAGYEPAFEAIVARYRAPLLRYAERFLAPERAEDAVQQSFVKAYEAMLRDGSQLNLRPWLYRIAHNTAVNALRDQALRHAELPDSLDGVERPDEAFERVTGLRELLAAVQALPPRQRDAIVLRELEGRSYEEIAAELGVSGGSVRQLLNRARNTLRSGATLLTPAGLVTRLPWAASGEPVAARVAELCGAAGAGAAVAKVCATVLVTGAVVGGVAVAPGGGRDERATGPARAAASGSGEDGGESAATRSAREGPGGSGSSFGEGSDDGRGQVRDDERRDRRHRDDDRSGPGGGEDDDDRSGPGDGDEEDDNRSGPGEGDEEDDDRDDGDHDGSGSGSDSGSGSSGSGSSGSGSGSGSGSSGSGSSGSGSGELSSSGPGSGEPLELETSGSSDSSGSGSSGSD